jgi:hypothetical protein
MPDHRAGLGGEDVVGDFGGSGEEEAAERGHGESLRGRREFSGEER